MDSSFWISVSLEQFLQIHYVQIRGWIAVSAEGLQGKGSPKRGVFAQTPVSCHAVLFAPLRPARRPWRPAAGRALQLYVILYYIILYHILVYSGML